MRSHALALCFLLPCCSFLDPRPDPTRFFVLATTAEESAPPDASAALLAIGPVTLPSYLARPEIVRRTAAHELVPSRLERWAEPLDHGTMRVVAEDLSILSKRRVVQHPWRPPALPAFQVAIDVLRFEPVEGRRIELVASIGIVRFADNTTTTRRERIEAALPSNDGDGTAAAMSSALLELARRVASAVDALQPAR